MRDLIVFGEDFGGLPSSTQHIIRNLNPKRKILWVNSIGLRKPRLSLQDATRALNKLRGKSKRGFDNQTTPPSNITVLNIKTIPAPRFCWERHLAKQWMLAQLRPVIQELSLRDPILWSSLPTAADLCGELGEDKVIYYCGDDFSALAGVDHQTVSQHEDDLTSKANVVFAASEKIKAKFPQAKTQLLNHGVEYSLFNHPAKRAADLPSGKPILGFYGSVSHWLDQTLIAHVAKQLSDWNLVFIGPQEVSINQLQAFENIHFLGARPHHTLPSYCQHWNVSWLPFKDNAQIRACSPLKLMEYIAAGQPIASTRFPASLQLQQQLNLFSNATELVTKLKQPEALLSPKSESVKDEDWQQRAQIVDELLEQL